ncbi:hypothetical protein [Pseudomonas aeruginosa]|uniref:hypothetical protein n=1 Tax=Pseudomonas aeruginosa group TaxID=136841 RepID=UPI00398363B6
MSKYIFDGFQFDVRRDGEAVDTLITMRIDSVDGTLCRELRFEVGRIRYWVIDGNLDEIGREFCSHISDYESDLVREADCAWDDIDNEYSSDDEADSVCYDERVYSELPKIDAEVIKAIVDSDANYED